MGGSDDDPSGTVPGRQRRSTCAADSFDGGDAGVGADRVAAGRHAHLGRRRRAAVRVQHRRDALRRRRKTLLRRQQLRPSACVVAALQGFR